MNKNTLVVFCQHGNERFGVLVAEQLAKHKQPALLANPRALLAGKRYIDQDMNRSYQTNKSTYESLRSQEILKQAKKYHTVIDIHTTQAKVGKVAIIKAVSPEILEIVLRLGFSKVVVMPKLIVKNALIGNVDQGISLEYGANTTTDSETANGLVDALINRADKHQEGELEVYYVKGLLGNEHRGKGLYNFRYNRLIGGYPILVGESRYKTYAGFFADKREKVIIGKKYE